MPEFLRKEYGPFTGTVWLVVIVGGVGLGLVMRKFMSRDKGGATSTASYGVETVGPGFSSGSGTLYNQGEIVNAVLAAIGAQTPPPASTDPEIGDPPPEESGITGGPSNPKSAAIGPGIEALGNDPSSSAQ